MEIQHILYVKPSCQSTEEEGVTKSEKGFVSRTFGGKSTPLQQPGAFRKIQVWMKGQRTCVSMVLISPANTRALDADRVKGDVRYCTNFGGHRICDDSSLGTCMAYIHSCQEQVPGSSFICS